MNTILLQAANGRGDFLSMIFAIVFFIAMFLIFRAVVLWYWKVDKIVEYQKKQIEQQQTIIEGLGGIFNLLKQQGKDNDVQKD